jgi:hypothetical protein
MSPYVSIIAFLSHYVKSIGDNMVEAERRQKSDYILAHFYSSGYFFSSARMSTILGIMYLVA